MRKADETSSTVIHILYGYHHRGKVMRLKELYQMLSSQKSSLARVLNTLEVKGVITKVTCGKSVGYRLSDAKRFEMDTEAEERDRRTAEAEKIAKKKAAEKKVEVDYEILRTKWVVGQLEQGNGVDITAHPPHEWLLGQLEQGANIVVFTARPPRPLTEEEQEAAEHAAIYAVVQRSIKAVTPDP